MRLHALACLPIAALMVSGQTSPEPLVPETAARMPNLSDPQAPGCADVIREVRDASGQDALLRGPAMANEGQMIAAVDKRIEGCAVLQMHGNPDDLRPLPLVTEDFRLRPAGD